VLREKVEALAGLHRHPIAAGVLPEEWPQVFRCLWRVRDYEVVALTRDIATLATPGGILYARRRPCPDGSVLARELAESETPAETE